MSEKLMLKKSEYSAMTVDKFNSGFVAITGAPNAGKSTLLNSMLGYKISITSRKPQTTRNRILGILTKPSFQFVFIDTPGVHQTSGLFNTRVVDVALAAIIDADFVLLVIDVSNQSPEAEQTLINKFKASKKPVILVANKIDKVSKLQILKMIKIWSDVYQFEAIIPVCALSGDNVEALINVMQNILPSGLPMFPLDSLTDMSEKFIVSEMIREKVFRLTGQEIPYSVAVTIDSFEEKAHSTFVHIHATIHVERESQKGMIIGNKGKKLRQIGEQSRMEAQKLLGVRIFLKLFVKTQKNWSRDTKALRKFGY